MEGIPLLDRVSLEDKARLEDGHWWYRGRRRIIAAGIARLPLDAPCDVLDAGSGTGRNLGWLGRYGTVHGIDVNPDAAARAAVDGHPRVRVGTIGDLPYEEGQFGLATCLDVLEHVEDDAGALAELRRVVGQGGFLVLTAPAYQALFSPHDQASGHVRRYSLPGLRRLATAAGWCPLQGTYFNTLLFPAAAARRAWTKWRGGGRSPGSDLHLTPPLLDPLLSTPMMLEAALVRRGIRLPFGLSILLTLRKA